MKNSFSALKYVLIVAHVTRRESGEDKSIIRDAIAIVFATSVPESRSWCTGPAAGISPSRRRGRRPCQSLPFSPSSGAVCSSRSTTTTRVAACVRVCRIIHLDHCTQGVYDQPRIFSSNPRSQANVTFV